MRGQGQLAREEVGEVVNIAVVKQISWLGSEARLLRKFLEVQVREMVETSQ